MRAAVVASTLVALALWASVAGARRDDLPTEGRLPADGVVVKDATRGIAVSFTCPDYHPDAGDEIVRRGGDGYHVLLATAADVGPDGLLVALNRVETRGAIEAEEAPGFCAAAPDASERGLLPTEPGTYWWQSYRDCMTYVCLSGNEHSDVYAVTVTRTVCTADRAALATTRRDLAAARRAYRKRRTAARRERVATLQARVVRLESRLRLVDRCAHM